MEPAGIVALVITAIVIIGASIAGISEAVAKRKSRQVDADAASRVSIDPLPDAAQHTTSAAPLVQIIASRPYQGRRPAIRTQTPVLPAIRPASGPALRVSPQPLAHWQEKGWRRTGSIFEGQFRAKGRSWRGRIERPYPGNYKGVIWSPPITALFDQTHKQRYCFQSLGGNGEYNIHFHEMPAGVDHAINCVEQILSDVC